MSNCLFYLSDVYHKNLNDILTKKEELQSEYSCYDPFHNYRWREQKQVKQLYDILDRKNIKLSKKSNGNDYFDDKIKGDLKANFLNSKSLTPSSVGEICFDKQDRKEQRNKLYLINELVYSLFNRNGYIIFTIIIDIPQLHSLIKKYQDKKLTNIEKRGKVGYDDIRIKVYEILKNYPASIKEILLYNKKIELEKLIEIVENKTKISLKIS